MSDVPDNFLCSEITFFSIRPPFTHATGSRDDKLQGAEQSGMIELGAIAIGCALAWSPSSYVVCPDQRTVLHCRCVASPTAPKVDFWSVSCVLVSPNSSLPPSHPIPACLCGRKSRLEIPLAIQLSIPIAPPPAMFSDSVPEATQNRQNSGRLSPLSELNRQTQRNTGRASSTFLDAALPLSRPFPSFFLSGAFSQHSPMGEHPLAVVAIAATAAPPPPPPPPRERGCYGARKEEAAADFRRRLYVYERVCPGRECGALARPRPPLIGIASQKSQLRRYSLYDSHPSYRIHLRNGIRRGGMEKCTREEGRDINERWKAESSGEMSLSMHASPCLD